MNVKAALILAVATLGAHSAHAVDKYTITETVPASAVSTVDGVADVIGIKSGMSAEDAKAILADEYGKDNIDVFRMALGTRQVQSQEFEVFYEAKNGQVYLTSPIAGSKVFAAKRGVGFKVEDGLPTVAAIKNQLIEKYGKPTLEKSGTVNRDLHEMFWYLGGTGKCEDQNAECSWLYNGGPSGGGGGVLGAYNIEKTEDYEKALNYGPHIVVAASFRTAYGYPDGVNSLGVSFVDLRLRAASARADYDLLMQKQADFDKKSVALPKL